MALLYNGKRKKRTDRSKRTEDKTLKRPQRKRDADDIFLYAKQRNKKIFVPEQAFDFMKNMNQQQLVDFLLPNDDDWHVKTSSGNASGS